MMGIMDLYDILSPFIWMGIALLVGYEAYRHWKESKLIIDGEIKQ